MSAVASENINTSTIFSSDMHREICNAAKMEDPPFTNIIINNSASSDNSNLSPSSYPVTEYSFEKDISWINAYYSRNIPNSYIYYNKEYLTSLPKSVRSALDVVIHNEHLQSDWVADKLRSSWEYVQRMIDNNKERDAGIDQVLNMAIKSYGKSTSITDESDKDGQVNIGGSSGHQSSNIANNIDEKDDTDYLSFWDDNMFRLHFGLTSIFDETPLNEEGCPYQCDDGYQRSFGITDVTNTAESGRAEVTNNEEDILLVSTEELSEELTLFEGHIPIPLSQLNDDVAIRRRIPRPDRKDRITLKDSLLTKRKESNTSKSKGGYKGYRPHHFAPLRHCFSHILQHRDKYPKQMTKLLNSIQSYQGHLAMLEKRMENSAFNIPLYEPFRCIALCICRNLASASSSIKLAEDFEKKYRDIFAGLLSVLKVLLEQHYKLDEDTGMRQRISKEKAILGSSMWGILNTELTCRKELHHRTLCLIEDTISAEKTLSDRTHGSYGKCHSDVDEIMTQLEEEANAIIAEVQKTTNKLVKVVADAKVAYNTDRKKLLDQYKESSYKMASSRTEQEKILRKIRELYKSLDKEQAKHHHAYCDVLATKLHLTKMEKCYEVFTEVAERRHEALCEAMNSSSSLKDILIDSKNVCKNILHDVDIHVSMDNSTEVVMKYHAAQIAAENALEWRRSLGDLVCLYTKENDKVINRDESWQLDFLLSNRRQASSESLLEMRNEVNLLDTEWRKMKEKYFVPFEISVPPLLSEVDERNEVLTSRYVLVELEHNRSYLRVKKKDALQWDIVLQNPSSLWSFFSPDVTRTSLRSVTDDTVGVLSTQTSDECGVNSDSISNSNNTTELVPIQRELSPPIDYSDTTEKLSSKYIMSESKPIMKEKTDDNEVKYSPTTADAVITVPSSSTSGILYSKRMLMGTGALRDPSLRPKVSLPAIEKFEMEMDRLHRQHNTQRKSESYTDKGQYTSGFQGDESRLIVIPEKGTNRRSLTDYNDKRSLLQQTCDTNIANMIRLRSADTALVVSPNVSNTRPPHTHIPDEYTNSMGIDRCQISNTSKDHVVQTNALVTPPVGVCGICDSDNNFPVVPPRVPRPPLRDTH